MTIPIDYCQATLLFTGAAVPTGGAVVLGFELGQAMTPSAAADAIEDAWSTNVMPNITNDVTLSRVDVKFGPDATGASGSSGAGATGGLIAPTSTPAASILVTKSTALGGRRGRGRMFIPGVDENQSDDGGIIGGGLLASLQTGMEDFMTACDTAFLYLNLLHEPATMWVLVDGQPRRVEDPGAPAAPAPTPVTELTVQAKIATQRRRLRR